MRTFIIKAGGEGEFSHVFLTPNPHFERELCESNGERVGFGRSKKTTTAKCNLDRVLG